MGRSSILSFLYLRPREINERRGRKSVRVGRQEGEMSSGHDMAVALVSSSHFWIPAQCQPKFLHRWGGAHEIPSLLKELFAIDEC